MQRMGRWDGMDRNPALEEDDSVMEDRDGLDQFMSWKGGSLPDAKVA